MLAATRADAATMSGRRRPERSFQWPTSNWPAANASVIAVRVSQMTAVERSNSASMIGNAGM